MIFRNETGLPAKIFRGQPEPDVMLATVVAKVSFLIRSDTVQQLDVAGVDVNEEDLETPFGYLPNDMVPLKPGVDLLSSARLMPPVGDQQKGWKSASGSVPWNGDCSLWAIANGERPRTPRLRSRSWRCLSTYANAYGGETEIQGSPVAFPDNPLGKGFILEKDMAPGKPPPQYRVSRAADQVLGRPTETCGLLHPFPVQRESPLRGASGSSTRRPFATNSFPRCF